MRAASALDFLTASPEGRRASGSPETACLDTAPNYLVAQVLAWAKRAPGDPRVPEALHLAVRSTRYGCGCEDHAVLQTSLSTIAQAVSTEPLDQADQVLVLRVSAGNLGSSSCCASLHNTLDEVAVLAAWFPIPAIDQELILKVALTSFAIHIV